MAFARTLRLAAVASLTAVALPITAVSQGYPAKPGRMIVPLSPGGGQDIVARAVGERLSARIGQPIVVENKPGATANIVPE